MGLTVCFPEKYANLRAKLAIDLLRFDQELIEIPQLVQEAAELAAQATERRETCKHLRDIAMADAAYAMRSVEGKAPSETAIASQVVLVDLVQDARNELISAERDADTWKALVYALQNKKEVLRTISEQILAGFMSPTSFVADARKEINEVRQQRRKVTPRE